MDSLILQYIKTIYEVYFYDLFLLKQRIITRLQEDAIAYPGGLRIFLYFFQKSTLETGGSKILSSSSGNRSLKRFLHWGALEKSFISPFLGFRFPKLKGDVDSTSLQRLEHPLKSRDTNGFSSMSFFLFICHMVYHLTGCHVHDKSPDG